MKYPLLLLVTAGLLLLPSCKPPEPPKITATDTGKSGPGGQTIKGGDVSLSFAPDGKPLTFTRGNSSNLLNTKDPGLGFYMTTGAGAEEKTIPFTSLESKDGKLILTADDKTRATLAVNAGRRHISFRLEKLENVRFLFRKTRTITTRRSSASGPRKKSRTRKSRASGPTSARRRGSRNGKRHFKTPTYSRSAPGSPRSLMV
jgi:dipeptidyl aminopeptidase/acylaminoacyl peptidase